MRTGLILTAAATYVAILGCVIFPTQTTGKAPNGIGGGGGPFRSVTTNQPLTGLPYKGVAIQIQRVDWIDEYKKCVDEVAGVGADTVLFVVDARQENGQSSRIYLDMRMTPTPAACAELIKYAKDRKLRVILMPIVLLDNPQGNDWRGTIKPLDWEDWFDSYRQMIKHFSYIAEDNKVDVLVVGSELVSTQDKLHQWRRTIEEVRRIYKGQLTYSSNWDDYMRVPFWNLLDLIAMNSYWKLGDNRKVPVEEVERRWKDIQKDLLTFQREVDKPLMFLEVGWCSLANAAHEPWDYTRTEHPVDLELQRKLYEGFFRSWHGNPQFGGFMVWEWTPGEGGKDDKGYTPENKPAEKVLQGWIAKPRWEVK